MNCLKRPPDDSPECNHSYVCKQCGNGLKVSDPFVGHAYHLNGDNVEQHFLIAINNYTPRYLPPKGLSTTDLVGPYYKIVCGVCQNTIWRNGGPLLEVVFLLLGEELC